MVVFQQDHVEKTHAVVFTAADLHGHLVQYAHAGRGLAGVEDFGVQSFEPRDVNGGLRRYAAHALHDVEDDAFGLQQRTQAARYVKRHVAGFYAVAVVKHLLEVHVGVETVEYDPGDFDAGDDAFLLTQQAHAAVFAGRDARKRRVVAVADVFFDAKLDKLVYERSVFGFHGIYFTSVPVYFVSWSSMSFPPFGSVMSAEQLNLMLRVSGGISP